MNLQVPAGLVLFTTLVGCATPTPTSTRSVSPSFGGTASAVAQDPVPRSTPPPRARDERSAKTPWDVLVAGTGTSNDDFDAGGAQAVVSVGYYFSDMVELSVRQNGSYGDAGEGSPEVWNGASRAALDFHVPLGKVVPYFGANFGYVYGDTVNDSLMAGPEAGVKIYLQDDAYLMVGAEYEFFFDSGDSLETAFDDGQFLYLLGMGMRF
jgi:hypothetical protein